MINLDTQNFDRTIRRGFDTRKREIKIGDIVLFKEMYRDDDEIVYTGRKQKCKVTDVEHRGGKRGWYIFGFQCL